MKIVPGSAFSALPKSEDDRNTFMTTRNTTYDDKSATASQVARRRTPGFPCGAALLSATEGAAARSGPAWLGSARDGADDESDVREEEAAREHETSNDPKDFEKALKKVTSGKPLR